MVRVHEQRRYIPNCKWDDSQNYWCYSGLNKRTTGPERKGKAADVLQRLIQRKLIVRTDRRLLTYGRRDMEIMNVHTIDYAALERNVKRLCNESGMSWSDIQKMFYLRSPYKHDSCLPGTAGFRLDEILMLASIYDWRIDELIAGGKNTVERCNE